MKKGAINIKTTNLVFSNFFHEIFSASAVEKETNFLLVHNRFFLSFGPMKSLFSFSSGQTKKNWGKENWWFGELMSRMKIPKNYIFYFRALWGEWL